MRPAAYDATVISEKAASEKAVLNRVVGMQTFLAWVIGILAAITCTFGNLAAYGQTNIKRLLAYSTIAHAGYMMMPIAAGLAIMARDPVAAAEAFAALLLYVLIYIFMNMGAFAIIAFVRNATGSEQIADYAGLVRSSPGWVVCFSAILFSLIGLPPLAGFMGKLVIFASLVDAGYVLALVCRWCEHCDQSVLLPEGCPRHDL